MFKLFDKLLKIFTILKKFVFIKIRLNFWARSYLSKLALRIKMKNEKIDVIMTMHMLKLVQNI